MPPVGSERAVIAETDRGVNDWLSLPSGVRHEYAKSGLRIQLTPECDGGCGFCRVAHKGKPRSFLGRDSVVALINDAANLCGGPKEYATPRDLYYHGSDVGTYAGIVGAPALNDFVERSVAGGRQANFSTAVPAGSVDALAEFINTLYRDQFPAVEYGYASIRISRCSHNGKRADELMDKLSPLARSRLSVANRTGEGISKTGDIIMPLSDSPLHMRGIYRRTDTIVIGAQGLSAHFFMPQCRMMPGGELLIPLSQGRTILPHPRIRHANTIDGYPIELFSNESELWNGLFGWSGEDARAFLLTARYLLNILDAISEHLSLTHGPDPRASRETFWDAFGFIGRSMQRKILSRRVVENCQRIGEITASDEVLDGFRRQCIEMGNQIA